MQYDAIINVQKVQLFIGQKYLRMEDQKLGLVRKQDVAKGEELKPKVSAFKICVKLWRRGEKINVTQTYHRRGLEAGTLAAGGYGRFFKFFL